MSFNLSPPPSYKAGRKRKEEDDRHIDLEIEEDGKEEEKDPQLSLVLDEIEEEEEEEYDPIHIITPSGKEITLNKDQTRAYHRLMEWAADPEKLFFTLSGFAGTGKTTCIYHVLKQLRGRVAVSAPTHKAKKVIARATGWPAETIQSMLGLRPNTELETFDINDPQFDPMGEKRIRLYNYLLIDEASMLNSDLFDLLVEEANRSRTKIIFMGDNAQLPPVNEYASKVFTSDKVHSRAHLSKVERQAESNPLMFIYDAIRNNLKSRQDAFEHVTRVIKKKDTILVPNPEFEEWRKDHPWDSPSATNIPPSLEKEVIVSEGAAFTHEPEKFAYKMIQMFHSDDYELDPDFSKVLCWTNAKVKHWNELVRNQVYGFDADPLVEGEVIMAYNNVGGYGGETPILENSTEYKIERITREMSSEDIEIYTVLKKQVDSKYAISRAMQVVVPTRENYEVFLGHFSRFLNIAKKYKGKKWRDFFEFKERHIIMHDLKRGSKLICKKDFDYAYAITTHKAQGSTYVNVFVDEDDMDRNNEHEERNKLKYVALSRPQRVAYILSKKTVYDR